MAIWMYIVAAVALIILAWLAYSVLPDLIRYVRISRM
jgi:hypothetical protein